MLLRWSHAVGRAQVSVLLRDCHQTVLGPMLEGTLLCDLIFFQLDTVPNISPGLPTDHCLSFARIEVSYQTMPARD